ncbi:LysR substrate-binding domain-containing protein [Sphingobium sp. HWE2-09]|uniref:LysR substrate-binding domain-containing protein n=1 Tax=Sphingobium sp. HWE2-09 TaxID=3108390 RepID=UPI002DCF5F25|nr:LysR substrate-binding domain-containing protein [Sphingobium sp. HWE2-09]
MRVTLRQIAVFEAVARIGSIAGAADDINLSPSATSMSLKDLETHLGVQLFARSGRRMLLSDQGRPMLEMARAILVQVQDMEALSLPEEVRGRLRIGAVAPVGNYVLPDLCAAFMHRHPGVRIEMRIMPSHDVMEGVRNMALDIGFVSAPVNSSYLNAQPWRRDRLVICVAPGHRLAGAGAVPLADLAGEAWVLEKTLSSERIAFTVEALKYFNSMNVALEADSVEAIKRIVRQSDMLACLSRLTVEEDVSRGELVALDVPELRFTHILSLVSRRDTPMPQACRAFHDFARRSVEQNDRQDRV